MRLWDTGGSAQELPLSFEHILAPVDFCETSGHALRTAARLAQQVGCRLTALYVSESFGPDQHSAQEDHLERFAAEWIPEHVDACERLAVSGGAPAYVAVDWARDNQVDLLVCGTHGRSGVRRVLLGSVAATMVRLAPCPVWVERGRSSTPPMSGELLVATDFSPMAAAATRLAVAIAARFSLGLQLVHVLRRPDPAFACEAALDAAYDQVVDAARLHLDGLGELAGPPVRKACLSGDPTERIVELARSEACSLIICGRRGRSGWRQLLVGSVAAKLTRLAPCPVLTVPAWPLVDATTDGSSP